MTKSILEIAISVDGYVAGLHDEQDWLEQFDDPSEFGFDTFIPTVGALVIGMRSYSLGVERGWFKDDAYGPSPIFVVCKERPEVTSTDADFRFVTGGIEDAYQQASEAAGNKNIYVFGGPSIVQQFLENDLLDEIHLAFVPILLGQGIPLFASMHERRIQLECVNVKAFSKGLASVHYKVIR
ncbi:MAG TPA: dihydrofolate reductase family protein [Candidatus Saccharimonadales bacterium]|nr:dihydrofolate reductase family protein [Candidatus Saccharimonadales bacterium]